MDLAAVVLTAIGTAAGVSTAVATGVTLLLRVRERQEPGWVIVGVARIEDEIHGGTGGPELIGHLDNAGDGTAFQVTASGVHCTVHLTEARGEYGAPLLTHVAVMAPGTSSRVWADCAAVDWERAAIVVDWIRPPTRLRKRRSQTIALREITECPTPPTDQ